MSKARYAATRRKFIRALGLTGGAALLAPIASRLISDAQGQELTRKRFVVWLGHQGIRPLCITPSEIAAGDASGDLDATHLPGSSAFTLPEMLAPLAPHRDRLLLLDGLNNNMPHLQHTATWGALSCLSALNDGSNEGGGRPGGITIDQHVAASIGEGTSFKSVLWGAGGAEAEGESSNQIFASGPDKPEPHIKSPALLFKTLFGDVAGDPGAVDRRASKRRLLLDGLRSEVTTLQARLAPPERRQLDHYLSAMGEFEKRQGNAMALDCDAPPMPPAQGVPSTDTFPLESWISSLNEMSVLALSCGMTNVVGAAVNNGGVHIQRKYTIIDKGTLFEGKLEGAGHEDDTQQVPQMNLIHAFHLQQVARFVEALKAIPEGNGTAFDNTVIVYTTDNGDHHHSDNFRWPMVVVGNAGGKLKADGRFLRYPRRARACADFWSTISEALDVPSAGYGGPGGHVPLQGPLDEILA